METIYTSGEYLKTTQAWHSEDSPWKASQITNIILNNDVQPETIAEIGCGAGAIIEELSKKGHFTSTKFSGFDISPQAIELAEKRACERVRFYREDLLSSTNNDYYDVLLVIDVFEHIPDYMGFVEKCRMKAKYKIFHVPLDIHVSSVLRNAFIGGRYSIGHLHYFSADSAIATLKDTGHEIVDCLYTNAAFGLFKQHPSIKKAIANGPRWLFSKFSLPLAARLFGGYSLLVLTK